MERTDREAIVASWRRLDRADETIPDLFYGRLFEIAPQYRALFAEDLEPQKRKLLAMLRWIVDSCDWPDEVWQEPVESGNDLFLSVLALGKRHALIYRVPDEAYEPVGEALLWALGRGLGEAFTDDVRGAWERMYGLLAITMKMGRFAVDDGTEEARHG